MRIKRLGLAFGGMILSVGLLSACGGTAATVATIEESAVPTAPYPDGSWVRQTFDTAIS